MSSRIRHISAVASLAALIYGGSAAVASPSVPKPPSHLAAQAEPATWFLPGLGHLQDMLARGALPPFAASPAGVLGVVPAAPSATGAEDGYRGLPPGAFAGYASATVFHTDPELATDAEGDDFGAEYDLGLSDAAHASVPVPAVTDELGRLAIPALEAAHSFGQGRGVKVPAVLEEFDLGVDLEPAVAMAPPSRAPVRKSTPTDLEFVKANSFEAEALARAIPSGCVIGDDLARGRGAANQTGVDLDGDFEDDDAPLLSVSIDDPPPPRAVSQSISRVALTPKPVSPEHFGGIAETRLTVAPITFGIPDAEDSKNDILFTLELAGEFALRAVADGQEGRLFFGPDGADDARPVARLFYDGEEVGGAGFGEIVPIKVGDETVGEIRIGDDPHAIGGGSTDKPIITGTRVAAAADVAVVRFFAFEAQQRVGHMEVDLTVPADGVPCPGITLAKRSDPASVAPGAPFAFSIDVSNPNDCVLSAVQVKDAATAEPGVSWKVLTTLPHSTISRDGTLTFNLDSLRPGERQTIRINAQSAADSRSGTLTNQARATGECGKVPLEGASTAVTSIREVTAAPAPIPSPPGLSGPPSGRAGAGKASEPPKTGDRAVDAADVAGTGQESRRSDTAGRPLPRTGAPLPLVLALPLLAAGRMLRRLRPSGLSGAR